MGPLFWALLELNLSDLRDFNVIRLRLDGPREVRNLEFPSLVVKNGGATAPKLGKIWGNT